MKTIFSLFLLMLAGSIFSQEDDYCPCEEDENSYDFLNNMLTSTDDFIYVPETTNEYFIVDSSMETEDLYIPEEDKPLVEFESESSKLTGPTENYPVKSYREVMIGKSRIVILKRKRVARMKRYKGKCPFF